MENDAFKPMFNIDNAYTIFQDRAKNYWVSTYEKEVFFVDGKSSEVSKIRFNKSLLGMINNFAEIHPHTLLLLGNNELIKIATVTKKTQLIMPQDASEKKVWEF